MEKDYRTGQKVIVKIELNDQGQDFTELDLLENGVILGYSPIFSKGRLSLIGLGSEDGMEYWSLKDIKEDWQVVRRGILTNEGILVYFKYTEEKTPVPWKAQTFRYSVVDLKKGEDINRFMKKNDKKRPSR